MPKKLVALAALLSLTPLGSLASARESTPVFFQAEFPSASLLRVDLRSGDVHVTGTSDNRVAVRFGGERADDAAAVCRVSLVRAGTDGDLIIRGCPREHVQVFVEVPERSNLRVRMPFGELTISAVTGDKDVELHAGEVNLNIDKAGEYGAVDLSVLSGEITARPFGVDRGGLFRSYATSAGGPYRLHAHVGAGTVLIRAKS